MDMKKKELATERVRLFPSTYKRLRLRKARSDKSVTIAQLIDKLERAYGTKKNV